MFVRPELEVSVSYQKLTARGLIRNAAVRWG
jgi:hypothetical protein